jgi:4-amino-4-deoxy-L-arabinose transferase-like glycosyltransferase
MKHLKLEIILLTIIFLLALFLRFYKLTAIPNGFNQDESAIGYNAYSILKTGKDEYSKPYPLYFKSFGDQKLPAYIYMTAISESIFGPNEFAVRLPSALLGSLSVLIIYFLLKEILNIGESQKKVKDHFELLDSRGRGNDIKNRNDQTYWKFEIGNLKFDIPLIAALLLAVNPWHLFFSRAAFEDNAALTFALLGVWMFLTGTRTRKWWYFLISILGFVLSLYSYNVTRLLSPLLLLTLILTNRKTLKTIPRREKIGYAIFLLILLTPFILTFLSPAGAASANGALITSTDIQAKDIEMRSYLSTGPASIIGKIFFNKFIFMGWQYLQNIIASLSTDFFFISGSNHGSQGIGDAGGFYLFEFPLIILGLITIIRNKIKKLYFFIIWAIIALLVLSLSKIVPHATRGYFLVIPLEVFSALGLGTTVNFFLSQRKSRKTSVGTIHELSLQFGAICFALIAIYSLVYYFSSYYYRFPIAYASGWHQQDKALALYLKQNENKYTKIIFDNDAGFSYTSYLFFTKYPPAEFQKTVQRAPDDSEGFSAVTSFGNKYEWKTINWKTDISEPHTLFITSPSQNHGNTGILATFTYPERPVVISSKEKIIQYPIHEPAYVLIESQLKQSQ